VEGSENESAMIKRFIETRRAIRMKITKDSKHNVFLNILATVVLILNSVLILYAILAISLRMTLSGVGLIDSLPIALYMLPLMLFLPMMIIAYWRNRSAVWNFILLLITSAIFGMLCILIRGFIIVLVLNVISLTIIFILGRFRPQSSLRKIGKQGIACFLLLNILGLTFPVSVVAMGQNPIAVVTVNHAAEITLSVPLADFDYPYQGVTPTEGLLSNLSALSLKLDFRVLEDDPQSWSRLRSWLLSLNETDISYYVTLTANRSSLIDGNDISLGTTELIEGVYLSHRNAFNYLVSASLSGINNTPLAVIFDFTLSCQEWKVLMGETRSLNLIGFSSLIRTSIDSIDTSQIEYQATSLYNDTIDNEMRAGILVESFVVDDIQDSDTTVMKFCGITTETLQLWDIVSVLASRSRFSLEMNGDVGEYLAYSYSSSLAKLGNRWSIHLGHVGNSTDTSGRHDTTYKSIETAINDIALSVGNGAAALTLDSLPSILESFGEQALSTLVAAVNTAAQGVATYTFRIYAFRAVFLAIDSFDILMF
jgi:hypothetical protein